MSGYIRNLVKKCIRYIPTIHVLPGLQGSIHEDSHGWPLAGEKSKCLYTYRLTPLVPQVMIKPRLEYIHCLCRDNSIPQPVPLITNLASKLELPHVQTIPLLEQFKTVPPPSTISNRLKKSILIQILKTSQNLEDVDQVSPQES